jgi:hypothetical protein
MEAAGQSKSSQWVEHTNNLLRAHARIHRGDAGLKANKAAFVYRVAVRENVTPFSEVARSFHLGRKSVYDPAVNPAHRIHDHAGIGLQDAFAVSGFAAWLLAPLVGIYGAGQLVWQALQDHSLRRELSQLRGEIQEHQGIVGGSVQEPENVSFAGWRLANNDVSWIDVRIDSLKQTERVGCVTAAALTCWNLFGALAIYSAFRTLPPGRWLLYTGCTAAAVTGGALIYWMSTIGGFSCGGGEGRGKRGEGHFSHQFTEAERQFLSSADPQLDPEAWHSKFGQAIVLHRAMCIKMLNEDETLTFSKPVSFIWQDGQEHLELTKESDLSWRGKELNQDYWGLFQG